MTTSGATNSGLCMIFDLGSTYSSYVLGSLSFSEFYRLLRDTAFVFSDVETDLAYIKSGEFDRTRFIGL